MSKPANPTLIGAFVIGAIALAVAAIVIFYSGEWGSERNRFVIYFDESLNGLNPGAPVKLRGVQIGNVTDIRVEMDARNGQILTPVFVEINPGKIVEMVRTNIGEDADKLVDKLIQDGLRVQLQMTSLVTGQLYIEAKMRPDKPVKLVRRRQDIKELPSIPSLQQAVTSAIGELPELPIQQIIQEAVAIMHRIKQLAEAEETQEALLALGQTLPELQQLAATLNQHSGPVIRDLGASATSAKVILQRLDKQSMPLLETLRQSIATADTALKQLQATSASLQTALNPSAPAMKNLNATLAHAESALRADAPLMQNMNAALEELGAAAYSLRALADYLNRHPEALLQGKARQTTE